MRDEDSEDEWNAKKQNLSLEHFLKNSRKFCSELFPNAMGWAHGPGPLQKTAELMEDAGSQSLAFQVIMSER